MYNPEYTSRPHILVLNKIDLPECSVSLLVHAGVSEGDASMDAEADSAHADASTAEWLEPPIAIVHISARWRGQRGPADSGARGKGGICPSLCSPHTPSECSYLPLLMLSSLPSSTFSFYFTRDGEGIENLLTVVREAVEAERRGELRGGEGRLGGRVGGRGGMVRRSSRVVQGGVEREKAPQWQL
ncbi:unnamed protein product [Closterium sp. NIES-65]|nr:unnamed protein product [Closterium sp. NIES-65]